MNVKNNIEFEWTELIPRRGLCSIDVMRKRLEKEYRNEDIDDAELNRIVDAKINSMITSGEKMQVSYFEYRYIPSTETGKR